jgi:hypothetical protein
MSGFRPGGLNLGLGFLRLPRRPFLRLGASSSGALRIEQRKTTRNIEPIDLIVTQKVNPVHLFHSGVE